MSVSPSRLLAFAVAMGLGVPILVVLASCHGCGSADNPAVAAPDSDASNEVEIGPDAKHDIGVDASDAGLEADADTLDSGPLPDGVPPGWQIWTAWSKECPLYVPGAGAELPPPIEWEPCSAAVPSYLECRRMRDTWSGGGLGISGYPNFTLDPATGKPLLQFTRIRVGGNKDMSYRLVAEADGGVRSAILNANTQDFDCRYAEEGVSGDLFAQSIHTRTGPVGPNGKAAEEWGFLGGPIDVSPPAKVFRPTDVTNPSSWYISDRWVVRLAGGIHEAWDWDFTESHTVYSSSLDPNGAPLFRATMVGGDVSSEVSSNHYCGVVSWNLEHGSRMLLRWASDTTKGAGNFDTDGTDMVWTYSDGPTGCGVDASNPEVWTAPYTTDPGVLANTAKRLRKDVFGMSPFPYAVGFGYAMRATGSSDLFVVRLSDGAASRFTHIVSVLSWIDVLGITEEEIFVVAHMKDELAGYTIARIRIDSIPFDLPPD